MAPSYMSLRWTQRVHDSQRLLLSNRDGLQSRLEKTSLSLPFYSGGFCGSCPPRKEETLFLAMAQPFSLGMVIVLQAAVVVPAAYMPL